MWHEGLVGGVVRGMVAADVAGDGIAHGVGDVNARVGKSHPRVDGGQHHLDARFQVAPVADRSGQRVPHNLDRLFAPYIADRVAAPLVETSLGSTRTSS